MSTPREMLAAIAALPLEGPVRVLNLSADQERVIAWSGLRQVLPSTVRLLSGPGSAASLCPQADLYQAIQLACRHPVTLLTLDGLQRVPLAQRLPGPNSLAEAAASGADVRELSAPLQAVTAAQAEPGREMVLFVAGFETLLAPLAGMILEGLPPNLSLLVCGRRVEPLVEDLLRHGETGFEALLLPGNRCAVTGTAAWERLVRGHRVPSAVAGYTVAGILSALHGLLQQFLSGEARLDNCYRALARPGGQAAARDWLRRVFQRTDGRWRGVGSIPGSALRLRARFAGLDADRRYPDYRGDLTEGQAEMPVGCDCAAVLIGRKDPSECARFEDGCRAASPYGPCMASEDGTCSLRSGFPRAA